MTQSRMLGERVKIRGLNGLANPSFVIPSSAGAKSGEFPRGVTRVTEVDETQMAFKFSYNYSYNHGYETPKQAVGYSTLRLWRDNSSSKFQFTSLLKLGTH